MSGIEGLERAVSEEPGLLDERIEEVRAGLRADHPQERADAGRVFRAAAESDPAAVEPHLDALVALLADSNGAVRLSAVVALAELAETTPEPVAEHAPALVALLERTEAPAVAGELIRVLTRIGEREPARVADADPLLADLLRRGTVPIRVSLVSVFTGAVVADPSQFPETVRATEAALEDDKQRVRRYAASALAAIATADPAALPSLSAVRDRVVAMDAQVNSRPWGRDENLAEAAATLRSLADDDPA